MDSIFFYCISLQGLFFFSLGCALAQTDERVLWGWGNAIFKPWIISVCLAVGLLLVVIRTWLWVEMGRTIIPWSPLFVPLLLVVFWKVIPSRPFPHWLTGASFPIYLIHMILWVAISKFCAVSGCQIPQFMKVETIGDWWVKWAVGFSGSLVISMVLHRYLPRTSSVLFGGR